ncbi:MAG: hypothetical protein RUMPE_00380 [Eubacteriales bacterium SKADARSKE-1]|nr:hypothetical protein [Eubacteriales bacterium SKADARSKE-1]
MDVIDIARQLGKAIQDDENYLNFKIASQNNDEDEILQNLIKEFNLKKISINNEISKENKDEEKIKNLNDELNKCYEEIMENESMKNYKLSKIEFDNLMKRVSAIIMQSANGEDPETTDLVEPNCGGSCSSCTGCH